MMNINIQHAQYLMRHTAWFAIGVAGASCRFDLPRLSGADVPGDVPIDASLVCATTCGASRNASCCQVPGGMFYRSYDEATDAYNDMGYPAMVSTFVLDKYEVTVGRFREFINAGMGTQASPPTTTTGAHPNLPGSGWNSEWNTSLATSTNALRTSVKCDATYQTWTDTPGANESKPMNCVTWYEAMAFCIWDGGYLPTEAEWNYAASGGNEQRAYPWSNPASFTIIDCTYANYQIDVPPGMHCVNGTGGTNEVGSESPKGDGRWGHSDLVGNVWEWTLDWYASAYPASCNDCANLVAASDRVLRGCGPFDVALGLRTGYRYFYAPSSRGSDVGLRCARTP